MKKLVIIPAFNEAGSIKKTIQDIRENASDYDYLIINDCSTDATLEICKEEKYHYINLPVNLGIGGAVQTGYMYAYWNDYDIAVQFDGDGQHSAIFLDAMCNALQEKEADMIIGSRFISNEGFQSSGMRRAGIRFLSFLIKLVTGTRVTDPTSGMRMINRKLIKEFATDYPKDYPEPESVVVALMGKNEVAEIPVIMNEREEGISSISPLKSIYYMIKVSLAVIIARFR